MYFLDISDFNVFVHCALSLGFSYPSFFVEKTHGTSPLPLKKRYLFQKLKCKHPSSKNKCSFLEDPLWKHITTEVIKITNPFALPIQETRLGPLSTQDKTVELYCPTEKVAYLLQPYDFIVLSTLQQYFPTLRKIIIRFPYKFFF